MQIVAIHSFKKGENVHKNGKYDPVKHSIDLEYIIEDIEILTKSIRFLRDEVSKGR